MKKILRLILVSAAALAIAACASFAVDTAKVFSGEVYAQGQSTFCVNEAGGVVPFLYYNDSTYIPVRTASNWMGRHINWDGATKTVTIDGKSEPNFHAIITEGQPDRVTVYGNVEVAVQRDVKIILDGAVQSFKNQRGEAVYPIMYNDVNYLPLRNVGEMTGLDAKWVRLGKDLNGEMQDVIFIDTKFTDVQKQEVVKFIATQSEQLKRLDVLLKNIKASAKKEDVQELVAELDPIFEKLLGAEKPKAKVAEYAYNLEMRLFAEFRVQCAKMKKLEGTELYKLTQEAMTMRTGIEKARTLMSTAIEQDGKSHLPYVMSAD